MAKLEDDVLKDVPEAKDPEPPQKEPEPEAEPSPKEKPEKEPPKESAIASILDEDLDEKRQKVAPKTVPLSELQAERAKTRELRRQLKEVQETAPQPEAKAIGDVLAGLEGDDYVSVDTLRKALKSVPQAPKGVTTDDVESIIANYELARDLKSLEARALASESEAMEKHEDYNQVIEDARDLGLISKSDRQAAMDSPQPAEKLYQIAKKKLDKAHEIYSREPKAEGAPKKKSSKSATEKEAPGEIPKEDLELGEKTDDEIFQTAFGPRSK